VTEDQIRDAVRRLAVDARIVAEASGAVPVAAYLHAADALQLRGDTVAVVSGGNIAPELLAQLVAPTA
jgi:threonine dehydratase